MSTLLYRATTLALALGAFGCTGWRLPPPIGVDDAGDAMSSEAGDAAVDALPDAPLDVATDAPADAPADATIDAPSDTPIDAPSDLDPPRPIAPLSTARVTSQRPILRWAAVTPGSSGTSVRLCRNRACTMMVRDFVVASGTSGVPPMPALTPGVWFWQLRAMCGPAPCPRASATWQFTVGHASAARDNSFGVAPDLNGDGVTDLVVGAPNALGGTHGKIVGAVQVYPGPVTMTSARTTLPWVTGEPASFGRVVAAAGDMNGDGFGDLVATAPGTVYFYLGSATGVSPSMSVSRMGSDGTFGLALAGVGDIDGDGYGDVVVGAPGEPGGGAVYVFSGSSTGPSATGARINSPMAGDTGYGTAVVGAGDVDGDGFADVAVSSTAGNGTFYLYRGSSAGLRTSAASTGHSPLGEPNFGRAMAGAGDVDGDGLSDLAVAAPNGSSGSPVRAWVYHGSSTLVLATTSPTPVNDGSGQFGSMFGSSLSLAGDIDADGRADLVVGAPRMMISGGAIGAAMVVRFNASGMGYMVSGLPNAMPRLMNFGASVASGDYTGDGIDDAAVGDPVTSTSTAAVYLYTGSSTGPATTPVTINDGANADFGRSIAE